jgi:hypothetical protein
VGSGISIELSDSQLREVLRGALQSHSRQDVAGSKDSRSALSTAAGRALLLESGGSQISYTLVRGLAVLSVFPAGGRARGVTEVATELHMKTSTVHRLITTLHALGYLERDVDSREYRRLAGSLQV